MLKVTLKNTGAKRSQSSSGRTNNGFSIPMKEMYKIALSTADNTRTMNIDVPDSIKMLDRVSIIQSRAKNILKGVS